MDIEFHRTDNGLYRCVPSTGEACVIRWVEGKPVWFRVQEPPENPQAGEESEENVGDPYPCTIYRIKTIEKVMKDEPDFGPVPSVRVSRFDVALGGAVAE